MNFIKRSNLIADLTKRTVLKSCNNRSLSITVGCNTNTRAFSTINTGNNTNILSNYKPKVLSYDEQIIHNETLKKPKILDFFNLNNALECDNDFQIKETTESPSPDPLCIIGCGWTEGLEFKFTGGDTTTCSVKPVTSILTHLLDEMINDSQTFYFQQYQGTTIPVTGYNIDVVNSVANCLSILDANLPVTSGFNYNPSNIQLSSSYFSQNIQTPGVYNVYQNIMLYAFRFEADTNFVYYATKDLNIFTGVDKKKYFFFPVYRNDCYPLLMGKNKYGTIPMEPIVNYLTNAGYNRWY